MTDPIDLNNYTVHDCYPDGQHCSNLDLIVALDSELKKAQGELKQSIYLYSIQRDQMKSMEEELQSYANCLAQAKAEIERLKEEHRWIPVEERLPEKSTTDMGEEYLVYVAGWLGDPGFVSPMNFDVDHNGKHEWYTGGFSTTRLTWNHRVTHWRPLPEK